MKKLVSLADAIDRFSNGTGRIVSWLTLATVLIGSYNAIVRYLDKYTGLGLSSNTYIELQWYLFGIVFLLAGAYTLQRDAHVRVDVFYGRLGERGKAWIDLLGTVLFLIPFSVLVIMKSVPSVVNSWSVMEMSPDPGGLPRYPIRTIIPIAFILLIIQGTAVLIRSIATLTLKEDDPLPDTEDAG
ncbi:MAG: TRAP transporter small permease subunit [Rhodothermales bacterium]|nr:TRAP transporter small permease subunit [Rhodothermales bacterium]